MTDVLDDAAGDTAADADADAAPTVAAPIVIEDLPGREPASWASRAGAFAVDVLLAAGVVVVFMLLAASAPTFGWVWWLCTLVAALVFFLIAANRLILPVITGWTLGRSLFGIAVVRLDGRPIDPWFLLLRDLAHLLDTVPLLAGWFWPLVDSRRRTFADIATRTEVRPVSGPRTDLRPYLTKAVAALGGLALLGALFGYLAVYRHETAVTNARKQISEQGPKIVPDVLSYATDSVDADFTRAQSLVTDSYRPQLVAQQEAIRKAGPIINNEYWVTNSAVMPGTVTSDHAQMLLLMQGQRGAEKDQRFITATVRASFVKSGDGQWQVSDITVLAKPAPPQLAQPAPPQPGKPPASAEPSKPGKPTASAEPSKPAPSSSAASSSAPSKPAPSSAAPSKPAPAPSSAAPSSAAPSPKQGR